MIKFLLKKIALAALLTLGIGAFGFAQNADWIQLEEAPEKLPGKSLLGMKQASDPDDCKVEKRAIRLDIDKQRYPQTAYHVHLAKRNGAAKVLHLDREGAEDNREESLDNVATKDGYDRDEYPPAVSFEGGEGASVRYVRSSDNRGAGSSMSHQLRGYCSGQAFIIFAR